MERRFILSAVVLLLFIVIAATHACKFKCKNGGRAFPKKGHKPVANGCGTGGLTVVSDYDFTPCCNEHDVCYHTCGNEKSDCDRAFADCMMKFCEKQANREQCGGQARMYTMGVGFGGCGPYLSSQEDACTCNARAGL